MSSQHIPAWQRIVIKKQQQNSEDGANSLNEDPLNITTHLASGTLTKKEKQRIIRGDDTNNNSKKVTKKNPSSNKKREKLARDEREDKIRNTVLKDQLRYLIDFYLTKVEDELPSTLYELQNVKTNYPEEKLQRDDNKVVEVWKFSKQKQNWLIKHFFKIEEIPLQYDDLLIAYFKNLKSEGVKDTVTTKCHQKIKEWNEYIEMQELQIKQAIEEKGHDQQSSDDTKPKEEQPSSIPPNKNIVSRCAKLLKEWQDESGDKNKIEIKNFTAN